MKSWDVLKFLKWLYYFINFSIVLANTIYNSTLLKHIFVWNCLLFLFWLICVIWMRLISLLHLVLWFKIHNFKVIVNVLSKREPWQMLKIYRLVMFQSFRYTCIMRTEPSVFSIRRTEDLKIAKHSIYTNIFIKYLLWLEK